MENLSREKTVNTEEEKTVCRTAFSADLHKLQSVINQKKNYMFFICIFPLDV